MIFFDITFNIVNNSALHIFLAIRLIAFLR